MVGGLGRAALRGGGRCGEGSGGGTCYSLILVIIHEIAVVPGSCR